MDFIGFYSSIIIILRGGILTSIVDFLESLSQAILEGIMLVGRLGVTGVSHACHLHACAHAHVRASGHAPIYIYIYI